MDNPNRRFQDMNLFQGSLRRNVDFRDSRTETDFDDDRHIDQLNEIKSSRKTKGSGKPLILAPPAIKSIEEKIPSFSVPMMEEEESNDLSMSALPEIDHIESEEFQESSDEVNVEELFESSSLEMNGESSDQFLEMDESVEEPYIDQDFHESEDFEYESSTEPLKLATAAYRGKNREYVGIKVRLPLHLADVDLEIDIFDTFSLARPISAVSNVECSLQSIDAEVLLPSANLFAKGILLLTMDYINTDDLGTMHSLKIHIPWKKIIQVQWIHEPELSSKDSREYMFTSPQGMDAGFTREYKETLVEKVDFSLANLHCVWNEQFINQDRVLFQGTARMKIDLYQKQSLDLQKLLSL